METTKEEINDALLGVMLNETTVSSVANKTIESVNAKDGMMEVWKKFRNSPRKNKCIVVLDDDNKQCGSIDVLDFFTFLVQIAEMTESNWKKAFNEPLSRIGNLSNRNPYVRIVDSTSMAITVRAMKSIGEIHVCPIVSADDHLVGILKQMDIINFLSPRLPNFKFGSCQIRDVKLGFGPVIKIHKKEPLIKAFQMMKDARISGVAVVDDDDKLWGNLSVSDIVRLGTEEQPPKWPQLAKPIEDVFFSTKSTISVSPDALIYQVVDLFQEYQIHRVYIIDNEELVGVITTTDIISCLAEVVKVGDYIE